MPNPSVRKAIIAAAGFGTRFLPQTKAMPKEMLPLVDKPIIQHIVEELVDAGITDIVIVTGYHKRSIEDHFDALSAALVQNLKQGGKDKLLEETEKISNLANFAYVRQKGAYGSATPVLNAAHLIGDEPFIYTFADDFIVAKPNRFKQMIDLYDKLGGTILPCVKIENDEDYKRYGVVGGEAVDEHTLKVAQVVEKPGREAAPSDLASVSGYLFTPDIFPYLEKARTNLPAGQEFFITTFGLQPMLNDGLPVYGAELTDSTYYDTGNKLEYLKTVIDFALQREDIGDDLLQFLRKKLQ